MLIVIVITHRLIVIVIIVITHLVQNCLLHIIVKLRSCHHANVIIIGDRNIKKMYLFLQSEVILILILVASSFAAYTLIFIAYKQATLPGLFIFFKNARI